MDFTDQLESDGFVVVEGVIGETLVATLIELSKTPPESGRRGGRRNLLADEAMRALAHSPALMRLVAPVLGTEAFPVRGTLFDKQQGANWKVPWHQDLTIAVKHRREVEGYGPWSVKEGVLHVQPPTAILERMLTVRLHLDDCPASNGALRVIAGTHRLGRLDQNRIADHVVQKQESVCEVASGGALLMRPLTIHASSAAESPRHRRVIHFDYTSTALAEGLEWFEQRGAVQELQI